MPLGKSTATTGADCAFMASIIARASPFDRPIEAGAEQRIDHDIGAGQAIRLRRTKPVRANAFAASAASPLSRAASPTSRTSHLVAALGQKPRRDKTVAAVVARPGDDNDAAAWRTLCRAATSATALPAFSMSSMPRNPARDRQPIGFRHFGGAENFAHAAHRIAKAAAHRYRAAGD